MGKQQQRQGLLWKLEEIGSRVVYPVFIPCKHANMNQGSNWSIVLILAVRNHQKP